LFKTVFLPISQSKAPAFAKDSKTFLFIIGLHLFKKFSKDLNSQCCSLSFSINSATSSQIHLIAKSQITISSQTAAI
jgi:hypothetical protein